MTALANRVAELEAAVAARDRFIAAVGHELRNVAAPLVLLADAAKAASVGPPDRRTQMLVRNLELLTQTVDRVSEVAQLRAEKLKLEVQVVELGALVREVTAECRAAAESARMELRVEAPYEVPGRWDRRRLRQIISNLVANAIRHSGSSVVEIEVRGDAEQAELTVSDRGRGIDEARRARLFDAFDVAEEQRSGGLGVGLWIVRALCQRFRGSVALADDHAPGARFRVTLPRV